jgi:hypothetical protein
MTSAEVRYITLEGNGLEGTGRVLLVMLVTTACGIFYDPKQHFNDIGYRPPTWNI